MPHAIDRTLLAQLKELYPDLDEETLLEIDQIWVQYLDLVIEIYDGITADPEKYAKLTAKLKEPHSASSSSSSFSSKELN